MTATDPSGPRRTSFAPATDAPAVAVFDLNAYFDRIDYRAEQAPTVETLRAIVARHAESIAFENLDPLLHRPVQLDSESLQHKLLRERRGGWCFEHNLLLGDALQALGFQVTGLAARVLWGAPDDAVRSRSHMLLRVDLDAEPWIADVGFGGMTLTAPLRLQSEAEQATPHEAFRLRAAGDDRLLQARLADGWKLLYRFGPQPNFVVDYEVSNWYLSNHPDSHFLHHLLASRVAPDRRYALFDNQLAVHHLNGPTEKRLLTSAAALRAVLEGELRLVLPATAALGALLERIAGATR